MFVNAPKFAKSMIIFFCEQFPIYGMMLSKAMFIIFRMILSKSILHEIKNHHIT